MTPSPDLSSLTPDQVANLTSLATAQANILANSQYMVSKLNADLLARYVSLYNDYVTNMQSGGVVPVENRHAPLPPFAWELAPANADGFVFYQVSQTQRVADPKNYPDTYYAAGNAQPNTTPGVIMLGARIYQNWFQALKGDTFPAGMDTPPETSTDGVKGIFTKFGTAVGPGWYLLKTQL